ncbi:MAG: alpha/beta hydrolase [Desulfobacteraceae bacterium]|nr:alpha/beta hydrolase [Desulfobacteraceae bacterium]MBC2756669.1 alpha/beta hydrolase [Desulfobacteraceae bacterium]
MLLIPLNLNASDEPVLKNKEYVILLHGMGRSELSMQPLEEFLTENGYSVINTGYPSTTKTVETLADKYLSDMVEQCIQKGADKIHIVTHSLGGIITRQYLQNHSLPQGSRIVMISPPNKGSELADEFYDLFIYEWINGPAGQVLGTGPESLPNKLKSVTGEIGVIAGGSSLNPLYSYLIPGEDDGKVSVESAKLDEMADFLVVPSSHSFIMRHPEVLKQVVFFLKNGAFEHISHTH